VGRFGSIAVRLREPALILGLLALALAARLYGMHDESPWFDEIISFEFLGAETLVEFLERVREYSPGVPPFYFLLQYHWAAWVSDTVWGVRLLSVLFGLGSVLSLYALGRAMAGPRAGAVAAVCHALSVSHVYYDQEIRMYALATLCANLAMLALWQACHGGRQAWWSIHAVANAGMIWTQPVAGVLLVPQAVYLLFKRSISPGAMLGWLLAHAGIALGVIAWLRSVDMDRTQKYMEWLEYRPGVLPKVLLWPSTVAGPDMPGRVQDAAALLVALALAAIVAAAVLRRKAPGASGRRDQLAFLFAWLLLPGLVLLGVSLSMRPMLLERYALAASGALFVLLGTALACIRGPGLRAAGTLLLVAVLLAGQAATTRPRRTPWPEAAAAMRTALAARTDLVLVTPAYMCHALSFHMDGHVFQQSVIGVDRPEEARRVLKSCVDLRQSAVLLVLMGPSEVSPEPVLRELRRARIPLETHAEVPGHFAIYRLPHLRRRPPPATGAHQPPSLGPVHGAEK
jgi:hypothetical protein